MEGLDLNIGKKDYNLNFQFKALRFITEKLGFDSFGKVQEQIIELGFDKIGTDLTFPQYDYLAKLVLFSIQSNPANKAARLNQDTVMEFLFNNLEETGAVIKLFTDALYKRMGKQTQNPKP